MIVAGRCGACSRKLDFQVQLTIDRDEEFVPIDQRPCVASPGRLCRLETPGDRMLTALAKRGTSRRRFGRR